MKFLLSRPEFRIYTMKNQQPMKKTSSPQQSKAPIQTFRAGAVSLSVWLNSVQTQEGTIDVPSYTFQRSYTNEKGEWQHSQSFKVNDLARLQLLLDEARAYLLKKEYAKDEEVDA